MRKISGLLLLLALGCGYAPGEQTVYRMTCYSGERMILTAHVVSFQPGAGLKTGDTMWDVDRQMYHHLDNMACTFELTGEWQ